MNTRRMTRWLRAAVVPAFAALALAPTLVSAQDTGTIRGTVLDATTQEPLSGVQVFIPAPEQGAVAGTSFGTITGEDGRFLIRNVPTGQQTVRVEFLGYSPDDRLVTVEAGEVATVTFRIAQTALRLDDIVVTGVAGATQRAKVPFEVSKVNVADLPVPAVSAAGALTSQVAGAKVVSGTGQPGQSQSITLRGATSINAGGRSQGPLLIVDGVILGSGNLADLDALDIESIEVVKGAAAASLYGSRAANGVIQIQTKRGTDLTGNVTRYTVRTEVGQSQLANQISLAKSHRFHMNEAGTAFIDPDTGEEVGYGDAVLIESSTSRGFLDQPFPGQTFDQIDRFFDPGDFMQNYVSMEGRTGNTNYYGSFSNFSESGIVRYNDGYNRQNFRLNLDHGLREDLQLSMSTFYSNSWQDLLDTGGGSNAFFNLTFVPPNIDLLEVDSTTNELRVNPNPRSLEDNPLYAVRYRDIERQRQRFMSSGLVRYAPVTWMDVSANVSYDRSNIDTNVFYPKGYAEGAVDPTSLTAGRISESLNIVEAFNASTTASLYYTIGNLTTKTQARYLFEAETREGFNALGTDLIVTGVPSLDVSVDNEAGSYTQDIRSEGYFLITSLDYADKYILDALVRRDGSSLFGAEERWQTYGRVSGAWRLGMEPWFQLPALNELKLRGSYGTAGGRPRFSAQYETYNVSGGNISPSTLGNRDLKPEFSREIEVGVDAELFDRFSIGLTYADTRTEDQILPVPLPGFAGFSAQWRNAGTLQSKTWEATLEATVLERGEFSWFSRLLLDNTDTEIVELNVPAFQAGSSSAYFIREGETLGTIYGDQWATSCSDLPADAQQYCDQFARNDDGYFVWTGGEAAAAAVGPDGIAGTADDLWGTACSPEVAGAVDNAVGCEFGMPVYAVCEDDAGEPTNFCPIGNTLPDLNLGFSNNFTWKGLSLYSLFDASTGFDIYNQTIQWAYREEAAGAVDQRGVPEQQKKPVGYYLNQYDVNAVNSHFVEDGSYLKLRELALRYAIGDNLLSALPGLRNTERVTLSLIGRNLYTWTDYSGYDPEVGNPNSIFGSASIDRFDGYQYPNFRTLTGSVEISF